MTDNNHESLVNRVHKLEDFIRRQFKSHDECEDGFYSCPKAENYFGSWDDDTSGDPRPCECGYDEAMRLLSNTTFSYLMRG